MLREFQRRNDPYLLLAPTGVAAQNIGGQTIHSALKLHATEGGFQTLIFNDQTFKDNLKKVKILIIDEVSMVSATLFTFLSSTFSKLHANSQSFGGICIIVIGDLAQLPPVNGDPVFQSPIWKLFYPLFLRQPKDK